MTFTVPLTPPCLVQQAPCLWSYVVFKRYPRLGPADNPDVTVVSAYFNLGAIEREGDHSLAFYKYLHWAEVFQFMHNPLVVYTDSEQVENLIVQSRRHLANRTTVICAHFSAETLMLVLMCANCHGQQVENLIVQSRRHLANRTKVIRVQRSELQAFRSVDRVRALFKAPDYPKHYPNTVLAEYPCSQHAKYELIKDALDKNYFGQTKYLAWLDLGYYRHLTARRRDFYVVKPPDMDEGKVAMTQVSAPDPDLLPSAIFKRNLVWVGGGMSLATRAVFATFTEEYARSVQHFLDEGLSNSDQQVIYSMFTAGHRIATRLRTELHVYRWGLDSLCSCWFYLGFLCYREV